MLKSTAPAVLPSSTSLKSPWALTSCCRGRFIFLWCFLSVTSLPGPIHSSLLTVLIASPPPCATTNSMFFTCSAILKTRAGWNTVFFIRVTAKGKGNCMELLLFWAWSKEMGTHPLEPSSSGWVALLATLSLSSLQLRSDSASSCDKALWTSAFMMLWIWNYMDKTIVSMLALIHSNDFFVWEFLDGKISAKEKFPSMS